MWCKTDEPLEAQSRHRERYVLLVVDFFLHNLCYFFLCTFFNILSGKTDEPPEGNWMHGTKLTNLQKPREEGTGEESKGMCHLLLIFS